MHDPDQTLRRLRREPLWQPGATTRNVDLRGDSIFALLPHRAPFLFVQSVSLVDDAQNALVAHRRIDPADPVFAGHFPGNPVYPGVLLVETIGQAAACVLPLTRGLPPPRTFATVQRAVFLKPVLPGDELEILVVCPGEYDGLYARSIGQIRRNGEICAAAIVEGAHVA